ncbi:MAG: biopolymer transporter ExbD [Chitinophagaceae bacterium]
MANIETNPGAAKKCGVTPMKKSAVKIDMTPMVDLGFLLITFFVFTSTLTNPSSLPLIMPKEQEGNEMPLGESRAMTVLVEGEAIYYYMGNWEQAKKEGRVVRTTLDARTGIRNIIIQKKAFLEQAGLDSLGKDGLMLLIKAGPEANYKTVIDLLDETLISDLKRHALIRIDPEELEFIRSGNGG